MRGGLVYYTSTVAGKEYQQFVGSGAQDSSAELLLDENDLAEGSDYFSLGLREPSPDGSVLAYSVDLEGDEVYELRFRDLRTGKDLADTVARTYYTAGLVGGRRHLLLRGARPGVPAVPGVAARARHRPRDGRPGPAGGRRAVRAGVRGAAGRAATSS